MNDLRKRLVDTALNPVPVMNNSSAAVKTPYQQNFQQTATEEWRLGKEPNNYGQAIATISRLAETDPTSAMNTLNKLNYFRKTPGNKYYDAYSKPTNTVIDSLKSYGIDPSALTQEWFDANPGWQSNLVYNGNTTTPTKPTKKSTQDEWLSYDLYQYKDKMDITNKAKSEWTAAQQELAYWAGRKDLNLSDDQIINRVLGGNKYPTLKSMNDKRNTGKPLELNEAIDYNDDSVMGVIWAARNDGGTGDMMSDIANAYLKTGNVWVDNPEIAAKLNRKDKSTYSPYEVGMTGKNMEEVGVYFGKSSFAPGEVEALRSEVDWDDATSVKSWQTAYDAEQTTLKAEEELKKFNEEFEKKLKVWKTPEKALERLDTMLDKYSTLEKMDNGIAKGEPINMTRAVPYRRQMYEQKIRDYFANPVENRDELISEMGGSVSAADSASAKVADEQIADVYDAAEPYLTDSEKDQIGKTPSITYASTASQFWQLMEDAKDHVGTKFWNFAVKNADLARNNYISMALSSLGKIAEYERYQTAYDDLAGKVAAFEENNGDAILASEHFDDYYMLDNGMNMDWDESGKYVIEDSDEDWFFDNLKYIAQINNPDVTDDEVRNMISDAQQYADEMTANRLASGEARKRYGDPSEEMLLQIEEYNKQKEQLDRYQQRIDDGKEEYEQLVADIEKKGQAVVDFEDIVNRRSGAPASKIPSKDRADAIIDFFRNFINYRGPEVTGTTSIQDIFDEYGSDTEGAAEKAKEYKDYVSNAVAQIDYVLEQAGEYAPEELKASMELAKKTLEGEIKAYEYYEFANSKDFKQNVEFGKEWITERGDTVDGETKMGFIWMNQQEKDIYFALIGRDEDYKAADEFYKSIEPNLLARQQETYAEHAAERAGTIWGRALNELIAIGVAPLETLSNVAYTIGTAVGADQNTAKWTKTFGKISKESHQANINKIDEMYGKSDPAFAEIAKGFYEIIFNRGRSAANAVTFGGMIPEGASDIVHAFPIAFSAASDALEQAVDNGANWLQSLTMFTVTFLAESVTEGIEFGHMKEAFKAGASTSAIADFLRGYIPNALSEMTGETINDISEKLADMLVMGDNSEHANRVQAYKDADPSLSDEDAEAMAWQDDLSDVVHTFIISAFSPAADIVAVAGGKLKSYNAYRNVAKAMTEKTGTKVTVSDLMEADRQAAEARAKAEEEELDRPLAPIDSGIHNGSTVLKDNPVFAKTNAGDIMQQSLINQGIDVDLIRPGTRVLQTYDTAVTLIETTRGLDESTATAGIAAALRTDSEAKANAAAIKLDADTVEELLFAGKQQGIDPNTLTEAIQIAALGNGRCNEILNGEQTAAEKVVGLAFALPGDLQNSSVMGAVSANIHGVLVNEEVKNRMAGPDGKTIKDAEAKIKEAKDNTKSAEKNLEEKQNGLAAAKHSMDVAIAAIKQDPINNGNMTTAATAEMTSASTQVNQAQRELDKAQKDQQKAETENNQIIESETARIRQEAEASVTQFEQAEAQAAAEAEAKAAAEAAALQAEEDARTGKAMEEQREDLVDKMLDMEHLEGEERDQKRQELLDRAEQIQLGKIDMSGMLTNTEGMLALHTFGRKLGMDIQLSDTLPENTRGMYQNGKIYLNNNLIKAGKLTVGQALVEAGLHEITHGLENTNSYKKYKAIVLDILFGGDQAKLDAAIDQKIADYQSVDSEMTPEKAEAEIIADFARTRLNDKEVIERLLSEGYASKIRNSLHNINEAMKNFFAKLKGEDRTMAEYLRKAERAFQKAIDEAAAKAVHPEGGQFSVKQFAQAAGMTVNEDTLQLYDRNGNEIDGVNNKVTPDMINGTPAGMLIDLARDGAKAKNGKVKYAPTISAETANAQKQMFADLMNMVAQYKDSDLVWEIASSTLFSAMKANSDPQYSTTVDFGTVCAKTQEIINVMSRVMLEKGRGLTRAEVLKVYNETANAGLTVPCPVCYVFSRWMGVPSLLNQMSQYQKRFVVTDENGSIDVKKTQAKADQYVKDALKEFGDKEGIDKAKTSITNRMKTQEKNRTDALTVMNSETATEAEKAEAKAKHDEAIANLDALQKELGKVEAYNWVTQALLDKNGKVDSEFQLTPDEILFDLRQTGEFAKYTKNWKYRNSRGAGIGKAIMPYSGETIGDVIYGTERKSEIKNPFLTLAPSQAADGIKNAIARARKQNLIGGQRLQSTSDYRPEWGLDYMMAFLELQAIGSKVQMYTKVAEAVDLLASMGGDINLSIMGSGSGFHEATAEEIKKAKTDKDLASRMGVVDGKTYVLDFSDVTGMDYNTAKALKDKYSNVQAILVGMNDIHIRLAMANPDIDFIIPWHSSGNSKDVLSSLIKSVGEKLEASSDYTDTQSDKASENQTEEQKKLWNLRMKILKGSKKITAEERDIIYHDPYLKPLYDRFNVEGVDADCYKVALGNDQAKQIFPYEYWDKSSTKDNARINGERFVEYCQHFGITPRFSGIVKRNSDGGIESITGNFAGAVYDENGNITGYDPKKMEDGYWKVLIDRPMYDNNGNYREQQTVDVTKARIGNLDENGHLVNSDIPLKTSAMYGPNYSEQEKTAVDNSLAAIEEKYSLSGDFTLADMDQMLDNRYSTGGDNTAADIDQQLIEGGVVTPEDLDAYRGPQRQFGSKTIQNAEGVSDQIKSWLKSHSDYNPDTNAAQIDRAVNWVLSKRTDVDPDGFWAALESIESPNFNPLTADGQARMFVTMSLAANKNDVHVQTRIADALNKQGTTIGRALQARKLFRLMTPQGRIMVLQKEVDNTNAILRKAGKEGNITLSDWVAMAAGAAQTEEEFTKVREQMLKELGAQMPVSWFERIQAWRMLSMLGNLRTHGRNIAGNSLFVPAKGAKDLIGAGLESIFVKEGDRTKAWKANDESIAFAEQDLEKVRSQLTGEGKYSDMQKVNKYKRPFGKSKLGQLVQGASDFSGNALEKEDWWFLSYHYKKALAGWMTANKKTARQMEEDSDLLDRARAYAIEEAKKATYRDANKAAEALSKLDKVPGLRILSTTILPFKKTPMNILKRGLEYSPLGLMKAATVDTVRLIEYQKWASGKKAEKADWALSPAQYIDRISSGLTGVGIAALGAFLNSLGWITVGFDKKDPEDKFKKAEGEQAYALRFKVGDIDISYTIDWAAPVCIPFFIGAVIDEARQKDGDTDLGEVLEGFASFTEPIWNLSMLDGVNSIFETSQYADENVATQILMKVGMNLINSMIPTAAGQLARTFDTTRRKAYVESGAKPSSVLYSVEQMQNKIPGATVYNIPYRDYRGDADTQPMWLRAIENLISPGYLNIHQKDSTMDELHRLYSGNLDDSNVGYTVPEDADKSFSIKGETIRLTDQQYDRMDVERKQMAFGLLDQLMDDPYYASIDDHARVDMVKDVWTYATQQAKFNQFPQFDRANWITMAQRNNVTILDALKDRSRKQIEADWIEGWENALIDSIRKGNTMDAEIAMMTLEEHEVETKDIEKAVSDAFRSQYVKAYKDGDEITMYGIEDILEDAGFDFDYDSWLETTIKNDEKWLEELNQ